MTLTEQIAEVFATHDYGAQGDLYYCDCGAYFLNGKELREHIAGAVAVLVISLYGPPF